MTASSPRIWTVLLVGIVFVSMVLPPAKQTARGQATLSQAQIDSLVAAAKAAQPGVRFAPLYVGNVNGNVTYVEMKNDFGATGSTSWGATSHAGIKLEKRYYRLQPRSEELKMFRAGLTHNYSPEVNTALNFTDQRQFNRSAAVTGGLQDFILNNQVISGTGKYTRRIPGHFGWDGTVNGSVAIGEKTFKNDNTQIAAVNGGVRYADRLIGRRMVVQLRGAYKNTWEQSTTQSGTDVSTLPTFTDSLVDDPSLGGHEDSVFVAARMQVTDSMYVRADYTDYFAVRRFADQARGSLGSQQTGEENLIWEREERRTEALNVQLSGMLFPNATITVGAGHSIVGSDYARQQTRFSETTTDQINADINYRAPFGTSAVVSMARREQFRDLGPQSVGSFDEVRRDFKISGRHNFSQSFDLQLVYNTILAQSFYIDASNPRDRDQLDNAVSATINSRPWTPFTANFTLTWTTTDFVNIDSTQSFNNRDKEAFDFRPRLALRVSDPFEVVQTYIMRWEFTRFPFHRDDDELDRNISVSTDFRMRFAGNLGTNFMYLYELHDRGSYEAATNVFESTSSDKRDMVQIGMQYRINDALSLVMDYDYSVRTDFVDGGADVLTKDGGIEGGVVARYTWAQDKVLRIDVKKANRFGPFNTEAQNDFWIMNSELRYAF